jgi:S1-C subfamily serine protease
VRPGSPLGGLLPAASGRAPRGYVHPGASTFGYTRAEGGVQIVALASGGTAERANMHAGYVVTSIDGRAMPGPTELETELQNRPPGTKVRVGYMFRSSATNSRMYYSSEAVLQLPVR